MRTRQGLTVWVALATVYVVWGSTFVALAVVVRDLPPFLAMAMRHLLAGAILLAIALPRRGGDGDPIGRREMVAALAVGALLFVGGHGALAWAQQTVPAGVAALIVGSTPLWMALLDRLVFGRLLPLSAVAGLVVGFLGLALLVHPRGGASVDPLGALALVGSALSWAAGSLSSRSAPLPTHPLVSAGLGSLAGGMLLAAVATACGELDEARWTGEALLALGYLVLAGSLVGLTAYFWLLQAAPTSLVATYAYVNPVVALVLGSLLLGEAITSQMALAGLAIVASVGLVVRSASSATASARDAARRRTDARRPAIEPAR
ncbi:MAG: EamA family transporter [Thermoleophilia bacterium]|nr:EamA family transporter [Thermoleophilia bacterium]